MTHRLKTESAEKRRLAEQPMTVNGPQTCMQSNQSGPRRAEATIGLLPTEMLLEVFSYLTIAQLLHVEDVCRRWKRVIQEEHWSRQEWISKEAMGYPDGDYLNNLIRLSRRVVQVKGFVDPFRLIKAMMPPDLKMEAELRKTTLILAKKLSSNASFPLSLIGSVVSSALKATKELLTEESLSDADTRNLFATLTYQIVHEYGLCGFNSLHVDKMLIHSEDDDPFFVDFAEFGELQMLQIPIATPITRLNVGCFVIRLLWDEFDDEDHCQQAYQTLARLCTYERLESVEIARVRISARDEHETPCYAITLEFHQDRRQFDACEFLCMLDDLHEIESFKRCTSVVLRMKEWLDDGRVKRVEMNVRSDFFMVEAKRLSRRGEDLWLDDYFNATLSAMPVSRVDTLLLTHAANRRKGKPFNAVKANGVLSRLKSLTISLLYSMQQTYAGLTYLVAFDTRGAVTEVTKILRAIKDSLHSLESLTLRFPAKGDRCPSAMFSVTDVAVPNVPLPRLLRLECTDLPCLPFIVSVVSQAPNLRHLSIDSKPFEDDSVAMRWMNTLVDSLEACPRLQSLRITVSENEALLDPDESSLTRHMRKCQLKDVAELKDGLKELNAKLETLSKRSNLFHVAVKADSWQYSFCKEMYPSSTEAMVT